VVGEPYVWFCKRRQALLLVRPASLVLDCALPEGWRYEQAIAGRCSGSAVSQSDSR
jgi:hypothetical protein